MPRFSEIWRRPWGAGVPGQVWTADATEDGASWADAAGGGGGGAGSPVVRAFPFAYNSANLLTGRTVYTPTVGDVLLDAWIDVLVPWDDVNLALGDFGTFTGGVNRGLFAQIIGDNSACPLMRVDQMGGASHLTYAQTAVIYASSYLLNVVNNSLEVGNPGGTIGFAPRAFLTADPIKVVVSQDGRVVGADPASTQGSAVLYLVTATPA